MSRKIGIVLVNLGSPAAPTEAAVRVYLKQFLSDRRIVSLPPLFWQPILRGIILRTRPAKTARNYEQIWRKLENGRLAEVSPLIDITARQAEKLAGRLGPDTPIEIAMRYGQPTIQTALENLVDKGCTEVGVLALYPQYAGATVGSVYDEIMVSLARMNKKPGVKLLRDYHDEDVYIGAIADQIRAHIDSLEWRPNALVCSFHGLPVRQIERGDSYQKECETSFTRITEALSDLRIGCHLAYQSRFGPAKWLEPSTHATLLRLARDGYDKVVVFTPGFAADSLETLEEINIGAHSDFHDAGGKHFSLVPCLNDSEAHMDALAQLAEKYLLADDISVGDIQLVGAHADQGLS